MEVPAIKNKDEWAEMPKKVVQIVDISAGCHYGYFNYEYNCYIQPSPDILQKFHVSISELYYGPNVNFSRLTFDRKFHFMNNNLKDINIMVEFDKYKFWFSPEGRSSIDYNNEKMTCDLESVIKAYTYINTFYTEHGYNYKMLQKHFKKIGPSM